MLANSIIKEVINTVIKEAKRGLEKLIKVKVDIVVGNIVR